MNINASSLEGGLRRVTKYLCTNLIIKKICSKSITYSLGQDKIQIVDNAVFALQGRHFFVVVAFGCSHFHFSGRSVITIWDIKMD